MFRRLFGIHTELKTWWDRDLIIRGAFVLHGTSCLQFILCLTRSLFLNSQKPFNFSSCQIGTSTRAAKIEWFRYLCLVLFWMLYNRKRVFSSSNFLVLQWMCIDFFVMPISIRTKWEKIVEDSKKVLQNITTMLSKHTSTSIAIQHRRMAHTLSINPSYNIRCGIV